MAKNKKTELKSTKNNENNVKATGKVVKKKPVVQKSLKVGANAAVRQIPKVELQEPPLTDIDLIKIEKKKVKKLAQKLKKKQNKLKFKAQSATGTETSQVNDGIIKTAVTDNQEKKSKKGEDNLTTQSAIGKTEKQIKAQERKAAKKAKRKESEDNKEPKVRSPANDAATVFVGNLPTNVKRVQLVRLFQPFGVTKSIRLRSAGGTVMHKHKQRKAAGSIIAYVELESAENAEQALALNGTEFKEHVLRVTLSKSVNSDVETNAKRMIFVGNLKYSATDDKLREIFSSCGDIEYIRCLQGGDKGCKSVAYVCFKTPDAVGLALELNETLLDDRPIHVERYSVKKLGAKSARDAAAAAAGKSTTAKPTGAWKRIIKKKGQSNGTKTQLNSSVSKVKKSEFRGVKVDATKKKAKKSRASSALQQLAKKIAPKQK